METAIAKFDEAMQGIETIHINFSKMSLGKVYEIQQAVATEVWFR